VNDFQSNAARLVVVAVIRIDSVDLEWRARGRIDEVVRNETSRMGAS
jgi:hypothetical protein